MKVVYILNIIFAGGAGIVSLFFHKFALITVWESTAVITQASYISGALWLTVAILSLLALLQQ
jgi:hypothetical protein